MQGITHSIHVTSLVKKEKEKDEEKYRISRRSKEKKKYMKYTKWLYMNTELWKDTQESNGRVAFEEGHQMLRGRSRRETLQYQYQFGSSMKKLPRWNQKYKRKHSWKIEGRVVRRRQGEPSDWDINLTPVKREKKRWRLGGAWEGSAALRNF